MSCLLPKHQSPAAPDCPCLSCPVFQLWDKEGPPPCLGTSTGQWGEEQAAACPFLGSHLVVVQEMGSCCWYLLSGSLSGGI